MEIKRNLGWVLKRAESFAAAAQEYDRANYFPGSFQSFYKQNPVFLNGVLLHAQLIESVSLKHSELLAARIVPAKSASNCYGNTLII